jgi:hypothetical protein
MSAEVTCLLIDLYHTEFQDLISSGLTSWSGRHIAISGNRRLKSTSFVPTPVEWPSYIRSTKSVHWFSSCNLLTDSMKPAGSHFMHTVQICIVTDVLLEMVLYL